MAYIAQLRLEIPLSKMTPEQRRLYNNERSKAAYYRRRAPKDVRDVADHEKVMTDIAFLMYRKHGPEFARKYMETAQRALNLVVRHEAARLLKLKYETESLGAHEAQLAQEAQQA